MEQIDENKTANKNAPIPIKTPNIQNNIFMNIKNLRPSKSKLKMMPGNLIDHEATSINTSDTQEAEKIQ